MAIDKIFNDANVDGIADNIFGAVNNSVSEVKAMQQRKAAENVQMVVEAFKKIETNITEKFDNVTDVIEKRVLTIKDGRDGSSGSDGRNGRDGKPGRDGANGKQGTPGTPGKDGVDGVDGVSVTNANIDFDGSLVISLSTGQQINVGEIVPPELEKQIKVISTMSTNGAVGIKDEGTSITAGVKIINFVGASVTATNSGDDVTVNVSAGTGTVTSVAATVPAFLSVAGSPVTTTGTLAISLSGTALPVANGGTGLSSGTSGGVLAYTATGTLASSAALAASALVIGGGAGAAPSTTTTGTGVVTALGVNTGSAGAFVVNGGALGSPSSVGTMPAFTLGGTVSGGGNQINNVVIGTTTPLAGSFTTLSATKATAGDVITFTNGGATPKTGFLYSDASFVGLTTSAGLSGNGLYFNAATSNAATVMLNNTTIANFTSAGLAVTGTLSATGTLSGGTSGTGYSFSGSAPATSLTLTSGGNLLVGTTSVGVQNNMSCGFVGLDTTSYVVINHTSGTGGGNYYAAFGYNGSPIGSITQNGTTAVAYNTSSDYRLKNTIAPMTGALAKVALLKPCTYKWNVDGSDGEGFIAHELAEVVPQCVTGEKDAVNEDGSIKSQGIDTSFLVATLTAAIQEQQALITQLTARITALETA